MSTWPYPLSVTVQQPAGRSRRCGFWVSPLVGDRIVLLDTAALGPHEQRYAGPDTFPDDTLLVIVDPEQAETIRQKLGAMSVPIGPSVYAALMIDDFCRADATLAERIRWR